MKIFRPENLLFVFLMLASCLISVFAQAARTAQETELETYIKANYDKREVMIPMRDGVKLFTSIYEPKDKSQKYPIMLDRTPYTVAPYGADKYKTSLGPNGLFAKEGYIFVYQDVRGRWMSEGEFVDVRPETAKPGTKEIDESTDTYDSVDWMIKNIDNNNGRVGVWGISYPGFYTSTAIINSHPAIKAASPQAPVSDWYHGDDMHHNGALFLAQNYDFFAFFRSAEAETRNAGNDDGEKICRRDGRRLQLFQRFGRIERNRRQLRSETRYAHQILGRHDAASQLRRILERAQRAAETQRRESGGDDRRRLV